MNGGHSANECVEENRCALGVGKCFEAGENKLTRGKQERDPLVWTAVAEIDPEADAAKGVWRVGHIHTRVIQMLVERGERKAKGKFAVRDAVDGGDGAKRERRAAAALVLAHELNCARHSSACIKKPAGAGAHDASSKVHKQSAFNFADCNLALTTKFAACKTACNGIKIDFANGCGHVPTRPTLNNGRAHDGITLAGNGCASWGGIPRQPTHPWPLTFCALADGCHG